MIRDESDDPRPAKQQHQATYDHGIAWTWRLIDRVRAQHALGYPVTWSLLDGNDSKPEPLSDEEVKRLEYAITTEGYGR